MASGLLPKAGVAAAIIVLGIVAGVAGSVVVGNSPSATESAPPSEATAQCADDTEPLDVVADGAIVSIVQELADRYAAEVVADGRRCVEIRVRQVSSAAVVGRLLNGWRAGTHGPRPEVWIPQSTVWVELLREQLGDGASIVDPDPVTLARSPTVMAMPRPKAEALGWPDEDVSWEQLVQLADSEEGWASVDQPQWENFELWLTDPRYTTVGLQTLLALAAAQEGELPDADDDPDRVPLSLFRVQRLLSSIDSGTQEQLTRLAEAEDPLAAVSAFPLEERQLWQYNRDRGARSSEGATASPDSNELAAVYPTGDMQLPMESDYPYVLLDAPWVAQDVLQYADEFGDYLLGGAARELFDEAGFRGPDNEPSQALRTSDEVLTVSAASDVSTGDTGSVALLGELRDEWVNVPRLTTTLFVVDVSGSMVAPVPGTDQTRLQATVDAAQRTLQIIPPFGEVGLWEFSTGLQGGLNDGDYRELVTVGPLDEQVFDSSRRARLVESFDSLEAQNDTALNDTVVAAYRAMKSLYEPGNSHTIILLTDGRNDDDDSLTAEQMLERLQRERDVNRPIRVVSIAYGDETDVDELAAISETVGGEVIASPELDNLEQLFIEALSGPSLDRS